MSILETFYILFKGETSQLKKSTQDAKKDVDDLNSALKQSDSISGQVGTTFLSMIKSATGALAAIVGVGAVIGGLKNAVDYSDELYRNSRALNINVEELDAWGRALEKNGGTAQGFQGSIRSLAESFHTTNDVILNTLPQFASYFQKWGEFRALKIGKQLGLDEPTIRLLLRGREAVSDIIREQKELGVVTEANAKAANDYKQELDKTKQVVQGLFSDFAGEELPTAEQALHGIRTALQDLREHKDFIHALGVEFKFLGAAALAIGAPLLLVSSPILAIGAAITGTTLAIAKFYEEIEKHKRGEESWIDDITEGANKFNDFFRPLNDKIDKFIAGPKAWETPQSFQVLPQSFNSGGTSNSSSTQVSVGNVTINTQATDADDIASAFKSALITNIQQSVSNFDNGRMA